MGRGSDEFLVTSEPLLRPLGFVFDTRSSIHRRDSHRPPASVHPARARQGLTPWLSGPGHPASHPEGQQGLLAP